MNLEPSERKELRAILRLMSEAAAVLGGVWLLLFGLSLAFGNVRNGAELIYAAKEEAIRRQPLLDQAAPSRVLVFGNSKVLTGFIPDLFDSLSGGTVSSYNLGLPDYERFLDHLEQICRRGERPTHVLLLEAWSHEAAARGNPLRLDLEDKRLMGMLFPFRWLPRDLSLFLARAKGHGGPVAFYRYCGQQPPKMLLQRGYYFIEGQSHYPGDRLPREFRLASDTPGQVWDRCVTTNTTAFRRLAALADRYGFQVVLAPSYFRQGQFAPAPEHSAGAAALAAHPGFAVVGCDYVLLPNEDFSDPVHLNRDGAAAFTKLLWELLCPSLAPGGTARLAGQTPSANVR